MKRTTQVLTSVVIILIFFSCKKEEVNTFNSKITSQELLNKTEAFSSKTVDLYRINYKSDGLNIKGFIAKPAQHNTNTKLPAIIFCRGGNKDFGTITENSYKYFNFLASQGYVVLASQLRGNKFSEGIDEFGGKDVNDILKLISIAKELNFVEAKNIHILGYSRGGMNAYQVSKLTDNINSIAVVGAPTNLFKGAKFRNEMYHKVMKPLIGDSIQFREEYIKRSSVFWHDKINEPILILHGSNDSRVVVDEAQQIIDSLIVSNKQDFKFEIFECGNHGLSNYNQERNDLIFNWFKTHNK
ncbi:prolyl oligopeptidase family serine peptidase [uncultured Lacinutrix sp.]|uniref:alpha/beta hydrolase family protein n=1 Tax=uncultured Lacinutrix sp. TaxID=574032 RepID=UPI00261DD4EB|nr:prolyl oligopeptidase family serine peptidase [uncultured Lacinutrix sp.]